jgi:hypothetical protein
MCRLALVVTMVVAPMLAPTMAHAKCAMPGAFLSPDSGATLPPNPVLYLFVPGHMAADEGDPATGVTVDLSAEGSAVANQVELVSRSPAFSTYRVTIALAAPAKLDLKITVAHVFKRTLEASYTIAPPVPAAERASRATGRPWRESWSWTCSHQSTWNVPLAVEAPAYRVEWGYSLTDYETGPRASIVFPRRMESFFRWDDEREPSPPRLELGHVNCMGRNVTWPSRRRIWAGVWALLPDGTEIALNDEPLVLLKP